VFMGQLRMKDCQIKDCGWVAVRGGGKIYIF
jgi:hypothetical protein